MDLTSLLWTAVWAVECLPTIPPSGGHKTSAQSFTPLAPSTSSWQSRPLRQTRNNCQGVRRRRPDFYQWLGLPLNGSRWLPLFTLFQYGSAVGNDWRFAERDWYLPVPKIRQIRRIILHILCDRFSWLLRAIASLNSDLDLCDKIRRQLLVVLYNIIRSYRRPWLFCDYCIVVLVQFCD